MSVLVEQALGRFEVDRPVGVNPTLTARLALRANNHPRDLVLKIETVPDHYPEYFSGTRAHSVACVRVGPEILAVADVGQLLAGGACAPGDTVLFTAFHPKRRSAATSANDLNDTIGWVTGGIAELGDIRHQTTQFSTWHLNGRGSARRFVHPRNAEFIGDWVVGHREILGLDGASVLVRFVRHRLPGQT